MTTNQKYEITEIAHEKYPFLHRIRALRDIGSEVKTGTLGGFVESEDNLSFRPGDDAWLFDDAIACNDAYVDKGSYLRGNAIACGHAYVSRGTLLAGHARAEDDAYIRGATLTNHARASGFAVIVYNQDTGGVPMLSGQSAVYGRVSGDVRLTGSALVRRFKMTRRILWSLAAGGAPSSGMIPGMNWRRRWVSRRLQRQKSRRGRWSGEQLLRAGAAEAVWRREDHSRSGLRGTRLCGWS